MNIDYINKVAPTHDKTSCSDESQSNARHAPDDFGGCYRCTLITAAKTSEPTQAAPDPLLFITKEVSEWLNDLGKMIDAKMQLTFRIAPNLEYTIPLYAAPPAQEKTEEWITTHDGVPIPVSYAKIIYEGWSAMSLNGLSYDEFIERYGKFIGFGNIRNC